jgi:hypothetical protein
MIPTDESTFLSHDLRLLESIELKQRIKHIVEIIEEVNWQDIDPDTVTRYVGFLLLVADNLLHTFCFPLFLRWRLVCGGFQGAFINLFFSFFFRIYFCLEIFIPHRNFLGHL